MDERIFYAGGTAVKDISAPGSYKRFKGAGENAFFTAQRNDFLSVARPHFTPGCVLLLMGARDPSLEDFARQVWQEL